MISDLSLCRFATEDALPRLGLIANAHLYDLSERPEPQWATMEAWLVAAGGRVDEALAELEALAPELDAVCPVEQLLDETRKPRVIAPLDTQEVWACGVTYEMSREARKRESDSPTVYGLVYDAPRPELFFKSTPHRVVGPGDAVAIRGDSDWDVPESELTLVITPQMEIVGYTIGNDMSSRDIEGENPLYLPQAKIYERCCALGPVVRLIGRVDPMNLEVTCTIYRDGDAVFQGNTNTSNIHRPLESMVDYLGRCNRFPSGAFLLTGTGVVPPDSFTLEEGDEVEIAFEELGTLRNPVIRLPIE